MITPKFNTNSQTLIDWLFKLELLVEYVMTNWCCNGVRVDISVDWIVKNGIGRKFYT